MTDLTPIYNAIGPSDGKRKTLQPGDLASALRSKLGDRLAFNQLKMAPELDEKTILAHSLDELYIGFSELGWTIDKRKAFDAVMKVAREHSYHPVVRYLDRIANDDSIDPEDLDSLATNYLGADDHLYDQMFAATLIGAVARALKPGTKFDTCCVLRGRQGIGKSSVWSVLTSPDWFCDTPQESEKDLKLAIHSCWIYELAELDAITGKKQAAQVKAMLGSSEDRFRPPYGSAMERHPRGSILVGTCNRDDFLRYDTGSRRFWVIEVEARPDTGGLLKNRDRIWKAAVLAFRANRQPILSPSLQAESERRNKGYAPEHPWLAMLDRWMPRASAQFTSDIALISAGCVGENRIERRHQMEAAPLLSALGFVRDKHQTRTDDGLRARLWRRPTQPLSTSAATVEAAQKEGLTRELPPPSQPLNLIQDSFRDGIEGADRGADGLRECPKQVERLRQSPPGCIRQAAQRHHPALGIGSGADVMDEAGDDPHWGPRKA